MPHRIRRKASFVDLSPYVFAQMTFGGGEELSRDVPLRMLEAILDPVDTNGAEHSGRVVMAENDWILGFVSSNPG